MHYADRRAGAELAVAFKLFCAARQNAVLAARPFAPLKTLLSLPAFR